MVRVDGAGDVVVAHACCTFRSPVGINPPFLSDTVELQPPSTAVRDRIVQRLNAGSVPSLAVHVGDISYARGVR
jgi:hypothetical protein